MAVVHNGIIENFRQLRTELEREGCLFSSQTDTEVIVHLISRAMINGISAVEAASAALKRLQGAYALAMIFHGHEDLMLIARRGSPLSFCHSVNGVYVGSDAGVFSEFVDHITDLEDGDWAVLTSRGAMIYDENDKPAERKQRKLSRINFPG